MTRTMAVLVAVACLVVTSAGGVWLWQQIQAASVAEAARRADAKHILIRAECAQYDQVVRNSVYELAEVTESELDAALEGQAECRTNLSYWR